MHGSQELLAPDVWREIAYAVNQIFWEYDEVLEGCVKELFQQLEQLGIEHWNGELSQVMDAIKGLLLQHLEDLLWAVKRMGGSLMHLKLHCDASQGKWVFLRKLFAGWRPILDRALVGNLQKSEKFLRLHHRHFAKRFSEYAALNAKVRQVMKKLSGYQVLNTLDEEQQEKFRVIYYYVKLWRYNEKSKVLPVQELIRALIHGVTVEAANKLFREYVQAMREALFRQSRLIKKDTLKAFSDASAKRMVKEVMKGYRLELMTLGSTIAKYREFLLRTDPNPYVRTRWGFTDWVVGPEPEQSKRLLNQEYDVETVERLFEQLEESIESGTSKSVKAKMRIPHDIQRLLHEMGQPLTSYSMTRTRAEYILDHLQELDELGSFNTHVVDYCGKLFSKALRADWKHHVLHELPLFHELYQIHTGIIGDDDDRKHLSRVNKFKQLIQEMESWVRKRETRKHEQDIELDMNDLKGYLQDFLAQVQRTGKEEHNAVDAQRILKGYAQQLLEYRYLFGQFFHYLGRNTAEGKRIRNKLLFVDQYFESVENKLHELRHKNWVKS